MTIYLIFQVLATLFQYTTEDASGQNGTSVASWAAMKWIAEVAPKELGTDVIKILQMFIVNFDGDKKFSMLNHAIGRGTHAMAEVDIPNDILVSMLKVDAKKIVDYHNISSSFAHRCGMVGNNYNVSNTIAAIYQATGQDVACVFESSVGHFYCRPSSVYDSGIHISLSLPNLVIGTVGGGTDLPTQKQCLEMLGCYGNGKVGRLAEIIAGYALALELSLMSSVASGHFVDSHGAARKRK